VLSKIPRGFLHNDARLIAFFLGRRQGGEALFNAKQQDHWTPLAVAKQRQNARMVEALERGALTFSSK
jgi:hypothetical protein